MPGLRLADLGSSRVQGAVPELRVQGGVLLRCLGPTAKRSRSASSEHIGR